MNEEKFMKIVSDYLAFYPMLSLDRRTLHRVGNLRFTSSERLRREKDDRHRNLQPETPVSVFIE